MEESNESLEESREQLVMAGISLQKLSSQVSYLFIHTNESKKIFDYIFNIEASLIEIIWLPHLPPTKELLKFWRATYR